jgi:hypothetical protein
MLSTHLKNCFLNSLRQGRRTKRVKCLTSKQFQFLNRTTASKTKATQKQIKDSQSLNLLSQVETQQRTSLLRIKQEALLSKTLRFTINQKLEFVEIKITILQLYKYKRLLVDISLANNSNKKRLKKVHLHNKQSTTILASR